MLLKILDEIHNLVSLAVAFITLRILWDFTRALFNQKRQFNNFGLFGIFLSILSGGIWAWFIPYLVDIPLFMYVWMELTLAAGAFSMYVIVMENHE